jgi:hypothetical protein
VYRLMVAGCAEAAVFARQIAKRELASLVTDGVVPTRSVAAVDMRLMHRLPPPAPSPSSSPSPGALHAATSDDPVLAAAVAGSAGMWLADVGSVDALLAGPESTDDTALSSDERALAALEFETELRDLAPALVPLPVGTHTRVSLQELYMAADPHV